MRAQPHHSQHDRQSLQTLTMRRSFVLLAIVILGVLVWWSLPKARPTPSRRYLMHISLGGLGTSLQNASFTYGSHHIPLMIQGSDIIPQTPLPAQLHGTVHVLVHGWLPGDHFAENIPVTTPSQPVLLETHVHHFQSSSITIAFSYPVSVLHYTIGNKTGRVVESVPKTHISVPLPPSTPGTHGTFTVTASAEAWEHANRAQTVSWTSIPYVTTSSTPAVDILPTTNIQVTFDQPIRAAHINRWTLLPKAPGQWHHINATTYTFQPSTTGGFGPDARVVLQIPGGTRGPVAENGSYLAHATTLSWATAPGSTLRLQELLAQEGYLPVSFTPSATTAPTSTLQSQNAAIYNPPSGTFQWKYPNLPSALIALWHPGQMSPIVQGAIMQFERVNGLTVDGIPGPTVWQALIADQLAGRTSPDGYTYISVTEQQPETIELWINGQLALTTKANTGISDRLTYLGTFPIYERLPFQIMKGKNPDGTPYADPVYWINYFKGGDAVHGFPRASYGFPQSLGCVELPLNIAPIVYHDVHYGTLVTVNPSNVAPAPATATSTPTTGSSGTAGT